MLTITAPAKLNLTMEVLGKRPDGFHEVRSVMQQVSLCDSLSFQPGRQVVITCDMPGWTAADSLVSRTARLLQEASGCSMGATIVVKKLIPL
ncbi:MAG: 4-diphosphocytidyl-2C-methyl-D-erythritol kinase, partial [Chloroflexota bacterium]